jgi:hypothetical protein
MKKNWMVIVLAMAAACGASAQTMYKHVGPDGKVTYSDKPPPTPGGRSTVIGAQPPEAPKPSAPEAKPQASRKAEAKQSLPPQAGPKEEPLDRQLETALIAMMGMEDLVQYSLELCFRTLPTSFKKYSASANGWRQRNAALLEKKNQVLLDVFKPADIPRLEAGVRARTQQLMEKVSSLSMASRIKWCDDSFKEIDSGSQDLNDKAQYLPVLKHRPRAG